MFIVGFHLCNTKNCIYNTLFSLSSSFIKKKFSVSSQTAKQCRYRNWKCFITTSIIIVFYVLTTQFYLFKYFSSEAQHQQKKRALLLSCVRWNTCNTTNTKTNIPANKQKTVNNWKYQHTALLFFHWVRCQRREYLSVSSFHEPDPSNPLSTRKRTRTMPLVCIHLIHLLVAHSDFSFLFSWPTPAHRPFTTRTHPHLVNSFPPPSSVTHARRFSRQPASPGSANSRAEKSKQSREWARDETPTTKNLVSSA